MPGVWWRAMLVLSLFAACNGCAACIELPANVNDDDRADSGGDSAVDQDSAAPPDTGPPPMCEVELTDDDNFDDDYKTPVPIPTEAWVCSHFDAPLDFEVLQFQTQSGGWVKVDAQAASRGSSADLHLGVALASDDSEACGKYSSPSTTDPALVWLTSSPAKWNATLNEEEYGYGDKYPWWLIASEVKSPVAYTQTETDSDHATVATALPLTRDDTVLAWLKTEGGHDFWRIEMNGDNHLYVDTNAAEFGSAANPAINLYKIRNDADCSAQAEGAACGTPNKDGIVPGSCQTTPDGRECVDFMWKDSEGVEDWNPDSYVDAEVTEEPAVMYLEVFDEGTGCADEFLWYTISFSTTYVSEE